MTLKRIMLAVMCLLLITAVVMMGVTVSRVSQLLQGILGGNTPNPPDTNNPPQSSHTPEQTDPSETDPTVPPTTQPTEPPTTLPTEPGHEHDYVLTEQVSATCDNYGYSIYTCTGCGKQDIPFEEQVEPYGHNYGAGRVHDPTCTEAGYTRYTCSRCGKYDDRHYTDALGHSFELRNTVAGNCVEVGYDLYECSRCLEQEQRNMVEPAGHSYVLVGEERVPSCTEDGFRLEQCQTCGDENLTILPAYGHRFGDWTQGPEGGLERNCLHCDLTDTSASLKITSQQTSVSADGIKMYILFVGDDTQPNMMVFVIYDQLNSNDIVYTLDPVRGLVVAYVNSAGQTVEQTRAFLDDSPIVIAADTTDPGEDPTDPGEDPTDPGEDPTDPSEDPAEPEEPSEPAA